MIYAIRAVGTPYIKFGMVNGLGAKKRLEGLQTGCPFELELVATCDGFAATEQFIHMMLVKAGLHHRGEWFNWGKDVEAILELMKAGKLKIAEKSYSTGEVREALHKRLGAALKHSHSLTADLPPRRIALG